MLLNTVSIKFAKFLEYAVVGVNLARSSPVVWSNYISIFESPPSQMELQLIQEPNIVEDIKIRRRVI